MFQITAEMFQGLTSTHWHLPVSQSEVLVISSSPPSLIATLLIPSPLPLPSQHRFYYLHFGKVSKHPGAKVQTVAPFERFAPGGNSAASVVFAVLSWPASEAKRGTPSGVATGEPGQVATPWHTDSVSKKCQNMSLKISYRQLEHRKK